tara:strand:- start:20863 stop:29097 length:8235 start_codon:yes stop_codon:yes gene_type:complete
MPSYYDALKVQNLIRTYRANPMMFNDDQLDELERLAADNQIEFKRRQSDFSLQRGLQQAQAGFVEGLTTFDLIPKEPRNTGEAIFRQLGHLAGFAPAILKAPVMGAVKLASKVTGKETKDIVKGRFTSAVLDGIDALDAVSVPMKFSRGTKFLFDKTLTKTGAESLDFLKHGARTRAITEEALGLASASAISNVWKGKDAIVDSYIGGAIAGGAFGGIGNFVSVGNLYKGTPQQVEQANKLLRAGVASAFMGIPSTLRNDPTEMQIYEYLLGGFFGYNTRPARETEAAKWINVNRDPSEIFRPEKSKEWNNVSKDAKEFIIRDHPMTKVMNSEGLGGSTGAALHYIEKRFPTSKWRKIAERYLKENDIDVTENNIHDFYRTKASELYKIQNPLNDAIVITNAIVNDQRMDKTDPAEKEQFNIKDISNNIRSVSQKLGTTKEVGSTIDIIAQRSIENDMPNVELFMRSIRSELGEKAVAGQESQLRGWFRTRMQKPQNMDLVTLTAGGKTAEYRVITKEKIGEATVGEKFDIMPATYLVPEAQFQLMTHMVKESYNPKTKSFEPEAFKIMEQSLNKEGEIVYKLQQKDLGILQSKLAENGRYIVHGVKDKDYVMTSRFRDDTITLENTFDILSNVELRENVENSYKRSLELEKEIFGDTPAVEKLHERKWISNIVNMAEMNNLPVDKAWALIDPAGNYGKSVADLNKRMTLFANRFTPMVKQSFENVEGTSNGEKFNIIVVNDVGLKSNTDGAIQFRSDFIDAQSKAMGRTVSMTGHSKPVIAAKTTNGFFATKSNGQEAFPALNEWMMANNIHGVVYESSAKLRGANQLSNLTYEKGNYKSDKLNVLEIPIETLQISSGTYENTFKDTKGASLPIQYWGQANNQQAKGYSKEYIENVVKPSLEGTQKGRDLVKDFQKNNDIDAFAQKYKNENIRLEELPFEFVIDTLLNKADTPMGKLISDRLMKLELDGELNKAMHESFEFDSDAAYAQFHDTNRVLAEALRGTFVAKHSMAFNQKNYFNALRKYVLKTFANPHIETGGKSILKGFTQDMLNYAEIDPNYVKEVKQKAKKQNIKDYRSLLLQEGDIYLDNGFRKMPVVLFGERYKDNGSPFTLGEAWQFYTGKQPMPKKIGKKTQKEWDKFFTMLAIRTPADSISGTRALRFRGFTNQKGTGSFTHHKDNTYLGGADKDIDSIKIFQGMPEKLVKHYKKNANERKHWFNKKGEPSEYSKELDKLFQEGDPNSVKVKDFTENKTMMFSPSFRFQVAKNSSTGQGGLGFGLSAKVEMQNMYDYIEANGGSINLPNNVKVTLKKNSPYKGVSAHRHFLDLGTKVVNVSADASSDPNLIKYNKFRDMLSNSIFTMTKNGKTISSYKQFKKEIENTALHSIKESVRVIKPHHKEYNVDGEQYSPNIFEVLKNVDLINNKLSNQKGTDIASAQLIKLLNEKGFIYDNYQFKDLQDVHAKLYPHMLTPKGLMRWDKKAQKMVWRSKKVEKQLGDFYKIIAEELSFASPEYIEGLFTGKWKKRDGTIVDITPDPERALHFIAKEIGQYTTIELLTDQYVKMHNEITKQGRSVNAVQELIPQIKKRAYKVKELAAKLGKDKARDNVTNADLDKLIHSTRKGLAEMEVNQKLPEGMLQDYFHYWLLSPIKALTSQGKNQPQYYKSIHGSNMIPMQAKRNFYQHMDKIYDRVKADKFSIEIKEADVKQILKDSPLVKEKKLSNDINKAILDKRLENLALFESDVREIRKFQNTLKNNSIMSRDFNEWYTGFTLNQAQKGNGVPRDATTIKLQDIKFINRYMDSINTNKNMELKLAEYYTHPLTVGEKMEKMNLFGGYRKIINVPVQTSKGIVKRDIKVIMSPIGNIANYFNKIQASIDLYQGRMNLDTTKLDSIMNTLSRTEKKIYMENLFLFREGIDKSGNVFVSRRIESLDKRIDVKKFQELDAEMTKFWKKMENSWLTTKDIDGNRFNWETIDKDKQYGKVNEFIKYDKNGKLDFKLFNDKVLNARNQSQDLIRKVGIEGVLRYQFEMNLEKSLRIAKAKAKKDGKVINEVEYRAKARANNPPRIFHPQDYTRYMHHSFNNAPEGLLVEQAKYVASLPKEQREEAARLMQADNEFINANEVLSIDHKAPMKRTADPKFDNLRADVFERKQDWRRGLPYKRSYDIIMDYQNNVINGYHKNLKKLKTQNEIDLMMKNNKDYKPTKHEEKVFKDLYKGIKDSSIESGGIPNILRYKNYLDVWADYIRLYARDSLGHQSFLSDRMATPQGRQLLHLNKKNLWYGTSDQAIINKLEKMYQSKLGKKRSIPFFNNKAIPKDPVARKEYFSRTIHNLGRMEAQYELLTLLANTGTWTTNIFGGATMTIGSAGARNYANSFSNKRVYDALLSDAKGNAVLKLLDGTKVTNRKELLTYLEERGVINNFIKNEFEYNETLSSGLKKAGVNIKDFQRDFIKAATSKKGNRDENVMEVVKRYGITDFMMKTGGYLMKQSERVNRLNAFIAHGLQAVESFKGAGKDLSLADQYVFERAERGIEMTQFLYQNAHRPAFMRTSMGKVLGRFKLFVFNSVRMRKEFYRQAKLNGFKEGSESYERFKDTFAIDMMMYALGGAFMFSLFDTTLPPPWDWVQALADYTFGDKREKEMAFFGSKLGPLNVLKPPIARVPEAFGELLTGQYEDFTNYTVYTMFPFGRGVRQIKQLADDRPFRGIERAPEILFRIPYNQMKSRIERAKKQRMQLAEIEEYLDV